MRNGIPWSHAMAQALYGHPINHRPAVGTFEGLKRSRMGKGLVVVDAEASLGWDDVLEGMDRLEVRTLGSCADSYIWRIDSLGVHRSLGHLAPASRGPTLDILAVRTRGELKANVVDRCLRLMSSC